MPGTVQPASALFIDPVASSTNITFNGTAVPPALLALDVEVSVIEGNPTALRKLVDTVAVRVTVATFAVVPLQVGRFAVAVSHETATVVWVTVTFDDGFAVVQLVTAVWTVLWVALACKSALAPASAAAVVSASNDLFAT